MIKILWADDQSDVVNTFSSILAPLSAKILSVKDGHEVVQKLKTEYFDVLLLDLKMSPDEWGGLWALEEIRKFNHKIPVIILSGEGTQSETIKALRLGAQDYVTKDRVHTELLQRVTQTLKENEAKIADGIANNFPTPLALPFKRFANSSESSTRLHRLVEFFEAYIRFCCFVGVCETRNNASVAEKSVEIGKIFQLPSMGGWNQSRKIIGGILPNDSLFFKLDNCINDKLATSLISIRNDMAHGAEPSGAQAASYLNDVESDFQTFVKMFWQYFDYEIVLPTKLEFDGKKFNVNGVLVVGANVAFPEMEVSIHSPLITNQAYLWHKGKDLWVNLFPFIALEPSTEPLTWKIMIYDSLRMDKSRTNFSGDEAIRYVDLSSGQRNLIPSSKPTSKMLPSIVTGLQ